MKKNILSIVIVTLIISQNLISQKKKSPLKTEKDKMAYAIGMDLGRRVFQELSKIEIPKEAFLKGCMDGINNSKSLLSDSVTQLVLENFQMLLNAQAQKEKEIQDQKRLEGGQIFLANNAKKDSVVTLPSGLQYKILVNGTGKKPTVTDTVVTHYRGTLIDGTEFDNSFSRGEPATFPVNRVIKGWTEALQLMSVGSKWELYIPSELAYGNQQRSQEILPNSVLIFTIELLNVK